jgi:hypothetical protein
MRGLLDEVRGGRDMRERGDRRYWGIMIEEGD